MAAFRCFRGTRVCPGTLQDDGFSRCCGNSAICLPNNICQALNAAPGASGYYIGSCTDRDYNSPACSNFCSELSSSQIVYDENSKRWRCCGVDADGRPKCDDPTRKHSKAPAPTDLLAAYSASVSTFTASSTSSFPMTSTAQATVTPTPTTNPDNGGGGLSTAAKAGAGVGGAIGGLLVVGLVAFLVLKRRRRKSTPAQQGYQEHSATAESYDMASQPMSSPAISQPPGYLSSSHTPYAPPVELGIPKSNRAELPSSGPRRAQSPQELPP